MFSAPTLICSIFLPFYHILRSAPQPRHACVVGSNQITGWKWEMKNHYILFKGFLLNLHFYGFDNGKSSGVCNLFRLKSAVKVKLRFEFQQIHVTTFWFQSKTKHIIQLLHKPNYTLLARSSLLQRQSQFEKILAAQQIHLESFQFCIIW